MNYIQRFYKITDPQNSILEIIIHAHSQESLLQILE